MLEAVASDASDAVRGWMLGCARSAVDEEEYAAALDAKLRELEGGEGDETREFNRGFDDIGEDTAVMTHAME